MERLFQSHNTPRKRVQIKFPKKGRTKQSFKDECDINLIIARHTKTGVLSHINNTQAEYGYATSQDFASAMRTVTQAQAQFNELSDEIKNRFGGSPAAFLDFAQDPANKDEGVQLGLWPEDPNTASAEADKTPPETSPEEKTDKTSKED